MNMMTIEKDNAAPIPSMKPMPSYEELESRNRQLIRCLEELYLPLYNAVKMAEITTDIIEDKFSRPELHAEITGKENCYFLTSDEVEQLSFATHHVFDLARGLEKKYKSHGEILGF
jgi:hypothetical protein